MNKIVINDMISSHCDADHYGGLWDLINPKEHEELKLKNVEVENFYHAGISWWIDRDNERYTAPKKKIYLSDCWKMR
jgi:beta-lactamase superfamily II metal-dependent hydrolase